MGFSEVKETSEITKIANEITTENITEITTENITEKENNITEIEDKKDI
jgi:hypothetical protein